MEAEVVQRGDTVFVEGPDASRAEAVLRQLYRYVQQGNAVRPGDVRQAIRVLAADPGADVVDLFTDAVLTGVHGRAIAPRTSGQRTYVRALRANKIVFGIGPAGTGKTYLAVAMAVAALRAGQVKRIILTRPAVEAGEKLGFLPGDLTEKVDPYLRPLFDALADMVPTERLQRMMDRREVEIAPLAFMRGRTLEAAWVILDEAQNTTVEQMRMFLTRMGTHSHMVVTGDATQVDLPRGRRSGLAHAVSLLEEVDGIDVVRFTAADVVRHPLVARIIEAYESDDRSREGEQ
ncbi:MAG: PhoH family protein [Deltaproteobacteria bacterium]|nr:MAG: PhoH family protein [Deltaproteobacteria bacterium]